MSDRKQSQQVFALALVTVLLAGCVGVPAEPSATPVPTPIPISHVYAFGDSFSDNGNVIELRVFMVACFRV